MLLEAAPQVISGMAVSQSLVHPTMPIYVITAWVPTFMEVSTLTTITVHTTHLMELQ
jgi:hypothetical protein